MEQDPVSANEEAERKWYNRCAVKELWKPVRDDLNDFRSQYIEEKCSIFSSIRRLTIACICNLVLLICLVVLILATMR